MLHEQDIIAEFTAPWTGPKRDHAPGPDDGPPDPEPGDPGPAPDGEDGHAPEDGEPGPQPDRDGREPGDKPGGATPRRFRLTRFKDAQVGSGPAWLVGKLLPRDGLALIYGPPKCGKSFWTTDLLLHVALGWEYRARPVHQGSVVYVACEGERGLGARAQAFRQAYLPDQPNADPDFYLLSTRLDLIREHRQLRDDIRAGLGDQAPAAIAIDTVNRSLDGSEVDDMPSYIRAADAVREAFNCLVILVHHSGLDASRPRGHTSLPAAADTQIAVKKDTTGTITATVELQKDGEAGAEVASRLRVVEIGHDADRTPITSCAIEAAEGGSDAGATRKATGQAGIALKLLLNAIADQGEVPPRTKAIPPDKTAVRLDRWREACRRGGLAKPDTDSDTSDAHRKAFERASKRLQELEFIGIWDDWVWPAT